MHCSFTFFFISLWIMRRVITIILCIAAYTASVNAQILRIGERIPTIDVDSSVGADLRLIEKEFTCLVFMHSKSEPSMVAIRQFSEMSRAYNSKIDIVLLTLEQDGFEEDMLRSLTTNNTIIAFDNESRTFTNFGVSYVPFCTIFHTDSRKLQWFGSLTQLKESELNSIIK